MSSVPRRAGSGAKQVVIETERFTTGDPVAWLDWSEIKAHGFRNVAEQEFLTAFFARVPELFRFSVSEEDCMINYLDSRLMIGLDVLDSAGSRIKRCLKVEFTGDGILLGDFDGSILVFMSKANADDSNVTEYRKDGASAADYADQAAEWIINEFSKEFRTRIES